jgi:transposase-like protein
MSEDRRETLDPAVQRYYYECPRCESTATHKIDISRVAIVDEKEIFAYKYVCQECCHVFELMNPDDVREITGWVD